MKKILLMSALLMTSYFASAQTLLRVKCPKGLKFTQINEENQITSIMGMELTKKTSITLGSEVTEVNGKEMTFKISVKRLYMKDQQNADMTLEFDSDKPDSENSPQMAPLKKMIGESFNATLDDKGKVIKVEGNKDLSAPKFPEKALNIGDTWTDQSVQKNPQTGDMTLHDTFTLSKVEKGIAYVDYETIYKDAQKKQVGISNGSMEILLSNGLILSSTKTQTLNVTIRGQEATVKINSSVTKKVVK